MSLAFHLTESGDRHGLHSFPTRRSSDLPSSSAFSLLARGNMKFEFPASTRMLPWGKILNQTSSSASKLSAGNSNRSEEHTSELQSHSDLVCRLLLEKKKMSTTDPIYWRT